MYKGQFQIGPIPDSVSYLYRVDYSARAGIISSATTSVPFTNLYRDILRDNVNYRMYKLMEDFAKAAEFRSSFENGFLQAKRRERANSGQGTFNVRPCGM
jgi:hypothetical protein